MLRGEKSICTFSRGTNKLGEGLIVHYGLFYHAGYSLKVTEETPFSVLAIELVLADIPVQTA